MTNGEQPKKNDLPLIGIVIGVLTPLALGYIGSKIPSMSGLVDIVQSQYNQNFRSYKDLLGDGEDKFNNPPIIISDRYKVYFGSENYGDENAEINRLRTLNIITNSLKLEELRQFNSQITPKNRISIYITGKTELQGKAALGVNGLPSKDPSGEVTIPILMPQLVGQKQKIGEVDYIDYPRVLINEVREAQMVKDNLWESREFQEFSFILDDTRKTLMTQYNPKINSTTNHLANTGEETNKFLKGFEEYSQENFGKELLKRFDEQVPGYGSSPELTKKFEDAFLVEASRLLVLYTRGNIKIQKKPGLIKGGVRDKYELINIRDATPPRRPF